MANNNIVLHAFISKDNIIMYIKHLEALDQTI